MTKNAREFRMHLAASTGLSDSAISAAWPEWWSDDADASPSAQAELRFTIARKLGLDPTSLLDDEEPRFVWDDYAKYKNFAGDTSHERPAITSFGVSVGRILVQSVTIAHDLSGLAAAELRHSLLAHFQFIRLQDLLSALWAFGIPTIHLRVFPLTAKRMCAMAVRVGNRPAILLARDAQYPAASIFHLAHEIGHLALGHVAEGGGIVDMEDTVQGVDRDDAEEVAADRYALELLTGDPDFKVTKQGSGRSARALADQALKQGWLHQIEPGTLALCYGHATGEWKTVQAALPRIYNSNIEVWKVVNTIASHEIGWGALSDDSASFLRAVMGGGSE